MFLLSFGPFWDLCFPLFLVPLLIFILFCGIVLFLFFCIYDITFSFFSTCQSEKLVYCSFEKITNMLKSVHCTVSHTFLTFSTDSFVSGLTSDFRE